MSGVDGRSIVARDVRCRAADRESIRTAQSVGTVLISLFECISPSFPLCPNHFYLGEPFPNRFSI